MVLIFFQSASSVHSTGSMCLGNTQYPLNSFSELDDLSHQRWRQDIKKYCASRSTESLHTLASQGSHPCLVENTIVLDNYVNTGHTGKWLMFRLWLMVNDFEYCPNKHPQENKCNFF